MPNSSKGTGFSLKDQLFNKQKVCYLAEQFKTADHRFEASAFIRDVMKQLSSLELKERIVHIATTLESYLDSNFVKAAKQITAALPEPLDPSQTDDDFGDFIFSPLGEFVVRNGLAKRNLKTSLKTLKAITQRFSMEDAIRAFIDAHPEATLDELEKWTAEKNYHVRRLVSEGTRPLLPWSKRLSIETTTPLPLLDALHADPTRFVTRSVANHLNDIAKSHPTEVLQALKRWKQLGHQDVKELQWMSRHALRTLVKQGHPQALRFLGFSCHPKIEVADFTMTSPRVRPGESLEFSFSITALRKESLMIDYVIDFVKANGSLAPKVHKLKQLSLRKGESAEVKKRHRLHANASTYTLYPGTHRVTLQINGNAFGTLDFELRSNDS